MNDYRSFNLLIFIIIINILVETKKKKMRREMTIKKKEVQYNDNVSVIIIYKRNIFNDSRESYYNDYGEHQVKQTTACVFLRKILLLDI